MSSKNEIHANPCLICGATPTDIDHIRSRGSGGGDEESNCWLLCRLHHTEKHTLGLTKFTERYPVAENALLEKGWYLDDFLNKWRR